MSRSRLLRVEGLLSSNIPKLEDRDGRSLVVMVAIERRVAQKAIVGPPLISNGTGVVDVHVSVANSQSRRPRNKMVKAHNSHKTFTENYPETGSHLAARVLLCCAAAAADAKMADDLGIPITRAKVAWQKKEP